MAAEADDDPQFGPYLVYERLGVGGMATVHRALERGIEGFERIVALKRLLPHLAEDASFIKAFVREAKLASALNHVNIVQIFELGRVGTEYFISMEYIDGRDIRRILRHARKVTGPPPINVTVGLLLQLCDALDYAHNKADDQGMPMLLVHRDVSPSNLLVTSAGHVKVIDFGIAKAQSSQLRTQTGRVKGKLAYMAPEAVSGKELDARSDLFAVGVIAHELLTARPLFASKNEYQTLLKVQRGDIMPPSTFNQGCHAELDAIVLRALARDPDARYASAAELREDLVDLRKQYNLATGVRDIAGWLEWAFALEIPTGGFAGNTNDQPSISIEMRNSTRRTPHGHTPSGRLKRGASDVDDAVEIAWGGEHESAEGPIVLDDVPDVSGKHLAPVLEPARPRDPRHLFDDDELDDDIPTPAPSHGPAPRTTSTPGATPLPGTPARQSAPGIQRERRTTAPGHSPARSTSARHAAATDPDGASLVDALHAANDAAATLDSMPAIGSDEDSPADTQPSLLAAATDPMIPPPRNASRASPVPTNVASRATPVPASRTTPVPTNGPASRATPVPRASPTSNPPASRATPVPTRATSPSTPPPSRATSPSTPPPSRATPIPTSQPASRATPVPTQPPAPRATPHPTSNPPSLPAVPASRATPIPTSAEPASRASPPPSLPVVRFREPSVPPPSELPVGVPLNQQVRTKPGHQPARAATATAIDDEDIPTLAPDAAAIPLVRKKAASAPTIGAGMLREKSKGPRKSWIILAGIAAAGAVATAITLFATRGDQVKPVTEESQPRVAPKTIGTVKFNLEPADADIVIGGKLAHAGSPFQIELEAGVHQIQINRSGYKSWLTALELSATETQTLRVVLEPLGSAVSAAEPEATLILSSTPSGLEALLDGKVLPVKTPIKMPIKVGPHTIILRDNGQEVWRQDLVAVPNAEHEFSPSMDATKLRERAERKTAPHRPTAPIAADDTLPSVTEAAKEVPAPAPAVVPAPVAEAAPPPPPPSAPTPPSTPSITTPKPTPTPIVTPKPTPTPTEIAKPAPTTITPPTPAPRTGPMTIPPSKVTKLSGEVPELSKTKHAEIPPVVAAKLCIDHTGAVTSADLITKLEARSALEMVQTLKAWRYTPYKPAGSPTPAAACFAVSFRTK